MSVCVCVPNISASMRAYSKEKIIVIFNTMFAFKHATGAITN